METIRYEIEGRVISLEPRLFRYAIKALVSVSKIKLAFRPTAVFSTDFHQQVTLFTVTWGRKVELVLESSQKNVRHARH